MALAAPWTPQDQPRLVQNCTHQGRAVVPAPGILLPSFPSYHHVVGQITKLSLCSTVTPVGAPRGSAIPQGTEVPMDIDSPWAVTSSKAQKSPWTLTAPGQ